MKLTKKEKSAVFQGYSELINASQVKNLRAIGHGLIEAKRAGAVVVDTDGNQYIDCDCSDGIFNLGRLNGEVAAAAKKAIWETDQGNFPMISREKAALASSLAKFVPGKPECSVFSVVRGEAFDFACKLARGATSRTMLVSPDGGWYGQMGFALSLSERKDKDLFEPLIPATQVIPYGDLEAARKAINSSTAAFFIEPVQAENHCRMPDPDYLKSISEICQRTGTMLVFDETQCGMGRTGKKFAYDHFGVEPDILIIGESLGAGIFPIAATIFTQELNEFMNDHPLIHLSTFGGSDMGCSVALKALEVYRNKRPWENAAKAGKSLKSGIEKIIARYKGVILSVQGEGLLLSMNLKSAAKARAFCKNLAKTGVLASPGQVASSSVVLRPALTISGKMINAVLSAINDVASKSK